MKRSDTLRTVLLTTLMAGLMLFAARRSPMEDVVAAAVVDFMAGVVAFMAEAEAEATTATVVVGAEAEAATTAAAAGAVGEAITADGGWLWRIPRRLWWWRLSRRLWRMGWQLRRLSRRLLGRRLSWWLLGRLSRRLLLRLGLGRWMGLGLGLRR